MKALIRRLYGLIPGVRESHKLQRQVATIAESLDQFRREAEAMRQQWASLSARGGEPRTAQELYLLQLLAQSRYQSEKQLARFEYQVFSQNGEDGILAEIFHRIGIKDRSFVELGVGNGLENNTAYLLMQGWRGWWVDGAPEAIQAIRANLAPSIRQSALKLIELIVTQENIAAALNAAEVPTEIDLLSIDVDRNTYWIWAALEQFRPRVAVIEYNSTFPAQVDWKIDYAPQLWWDETFNFGASLKALERLGRKLGYNLIGCDLAGSNAFFVREDLCADHFLAPFDAETHYEPARYWLLRTSGHPRGYGPFAGQTD